MTATGVIRKVCIEKLFAFIETSYPDLPSVFFHYRALDSAIAFDDRLTGAKVSFTYQWEKQGPRATSVWLAEGGDGGAA